MGYRRDDIPLELRLLMELCHVAQYDRGARMLAGLGLDRDWHCDWLEEIFAAFGEALYVSVLGIEVHYPVLGERPPDETRHPFVAELPCEHTGLETEHALSLIRRYLDTTFRAPVLVNSKPTCKGVVTNLDADAQIVEIDLTLANEAGETRVVSTARVELP